MPCATLTSKGQITIPKEVRERLRLHSGDRIDFSILGDGEALMRPVTRKVDEVFGCLRDKARRAGRPVGVEEMNEAVRERMRRTMP